MIVEVLEHLDYEPLPIKIVSCGSEIDAAVIEKYARMWLVNRDRFPICNSGCTTKIVTAVQVSSRKVNLLLQWVCQICLQAFLADLGNNFQSIVEVYVGLSERERRTHDLGSFYSFEGRNVTFEDGISEFVKPFEINTYPASIKQIHDWCAKTGYTTSAERQNHGNTYLNNPLVSHMSLRASKSTRQHYGAVASR